MLALKSWHRLRTPIGIDMGAMGVRAAQATLRDGVYEVQRAAQSELPWSGKGPEPDGEDAGKLLVNCLPKGGFRGRTAAAALSTPDLEYHALDLPAAALKEDAAPVIRVEVERLSAQTSLAIETRHWILPAPGTPGPNTLAVGASQEAVARMLEVCAQAGLHCTRVEPAATALVRFGLRLARWEAKSVWGVLDLGARQSRLVLCSGETPILVRTTGTGGRSWTQRIADALQLSFKAAEVHKRTHGITLSGRVQDREKPDGGRSELSALLLGALRLDLNELAAEVKRSYEYVLGCYPHHQASDLVLVGGGALLRNLAEHLSQGLGIAVNPASEYLGRSDCRVSFLNAGRESMESYALAIGLTMEKE